MKSSSKQFRITVVASYKAPDPTEKPRHQTVYFCLDPNCIALGHQDSERIGAMITYPKWTGKLRIPGDLKENPEVKELKVEGIEFI